MGRPTKERRRLLVGQDRERQWKNAQLLDQIVDFRPALEVRRKDDLLRVRATRMCNGPFNELLSGGALVQVERVLNFETVTGEVTDDFGSNPRTGRPFV